MSDYVDKFGLFGKEILIRDTETHNKIDNYITTNDVAIGNLKNETKTINNNITLINADLQNIKNNYLTTPIDARNVFFVDAEGNGDFKKINECVDWLKTNRKTLITGQSLKPSNILILLNNGVYTEDVDLSGLSGMTFLGLGCVKLTAYSDSLNGCLYLNGLMEFHNIQFFSNKGNSYAVHYEGGGLDISTNGALYNETIFYNCKMISTVNAGVGIGCNNNHTRLGFYGCEFRGYKGRDVYIHNSVYGGVDNIVTFNSCVFFQSGKMYIDDAANFNGNVNKLSLILNGNSCRYMTFRRTEKTEYSYIADNSNITISVLSENNAGYAFNYATYRGSSISCYSDFVKQNNKTSCYTSVFYPNIDKFNVKLLSAIIESNNQDITAATSFTVSTNCINVAIPNSIGSVPDKIILNFIFTPK